MIYNGFILISETTSRQHLAILRQHGERVFFNLAGSETTFTQGETTLNCKCCLTKIQMWRGL
nr:MAG TPA: hypothetical protein [Caudoviricetes sp.]